MKFKLLFAASLAMLATISCTKDETVPVADVLPLPVHIEQTQGFFNAKGAKVICSTAMDQASCDAVADFTKRLHTVSHKLSPYYVSDEKGYGNAFYFDVDSSLESEEYTVEITPEQACIKASDRAGFLNAIATLKQLLPVQIYVDERAPKGTSFNMPCVSIKDKPFFGYRGMHLDVSRHFFDVNEVKKYLDVMAMYKLNRLHWHLTDDQGWRIELKSHPEVHEIGGWREGTVVKKEWGTSDGIRYGGYYTQDEIKDVVAYAEKLGITVIPEIDLPGHMLGVLAAHPELGCTGGPYKVWERWGISDDVLCVGKEETMVLLEEIIGEVADLFPSEYFHIGGDECPKTEWEKCPCCQAKIKELGLKSDKHATKEQRLQSYVTSRIQNFLATKGKKIIGWDEILEGELEPGATVMSWRGVEGGIEAAKRGFDAIMTPSPFVYFDYYQSKDTDNEPFGIGGYLPIEKVYGYNPLDGLNEQEAAHILGVQANLWTEYIPTNEHLEYMLLPRMFALCELQWCKYDTRDFARLSESIKNHQFKILELAGYNYRPLDE